MNVKDLVTLSYLDLQEGDGVSGETCPVCKGGDSGERTFFVGRRDGVLFWKCYRASCGFGGSERGSYAGLHPRTKAANTRGITGRWYVRDAEALPEHIREHLSNTFHLDSQATARAGFGWCAAEQRVVMPVYNAQMEILGSQLRSYSGAKPKTISYTEENALACYTTKHTTGVIIVEDQISAIRASHYLPSVALLGTDLTDVKAEEIKRCFTGQRFLALDADAWNKAVGYAIKYRQQLGLKLIKLTKDLKNLSPLELETFMLENQICQL